MKRKFILKKRRLEEEADPEIQLVRLQEGKQRRKMTRESQGSLLNRAKKEERVVLQAERAPPAKLRVARNNPQKARMVRDR